MLGVLTSYEDFKRNRISNVYIIAAVVAAFFTNIVDNYLAMAPWSTKQLYMQTTILNACISLLAGFVLWYFKIWRAGDGKLFFAYASLLPISTYYYGYLNYFPSFAILINTLIPLFLLLTLNLWITTDSNEKFETLKKIMNPKQIFYMLVLLISTQWVLSFLFHYLLSTDDVFITGYLSLFILIFFMDYFQESLYKLSVVVALLRLLMDYGTITSQTFITHFILPFALLILAINFIMGLSSFRFNERVRIMNLKPGMCCSERIIQKGRFYITSATSKEAAKYLNINYENLTNSDVEKLKKLYKVHKLKFNELTMRQTMPFAPFLFLGVLLTILVRGDIVTYSKLFLLPYIIH